MTERNHVTSPRYIDTADQAKMIRRSLREAFPGVKFSVRTSRYAGGSSIDVHWRDGPSEAQVEAVVGRFRSGGFDGMTDCKYKIGRYMAGEEVRFGADFLHLRRDYSRRFVEKYAPRAAARAGVDLTGTTIRGSDALGYWIEGIREHSDSVRWSAEFVKYSEVVAQDSPTARMVGLATW